MTVSGLKTILEGFSDNDEIAVAITVNNHEIPVVTYDIGFGASEHDELMLEVAVYSSDFDN
ncbi:MAG: hypothetical protein VB078_05715 [Clostridiaceae bacterium]|nr:hypothetical protein [Clostridiaceae bacterium]